MVQARCTNPGCNAILPCADNHVGHTGKCPRCGTMFVITPLTEVHGPAEAGASETTHEAGDAFPAVADSAVPLGQSGFLRIADIHDSFADGGGVPAARSATAPPVGSAPGLDSDGLIPFANEEWSPAEALAADDAGRDTPSSAPSIPIRPLETGAGAPALAPVTPDEDEEPYVDVRQADASHRLAEPERGAAGLVKWPVLTVLVLAALLCGRVRGLWWAFLNLTQFGFVGGRTATVHVEVAQLTSAIQPVATVLAAAAFVGLWQRKDWGRQLCIAGLAAQGVVAAIWTVVELSRANGQSTTVFGAVVCAAHALQCALLAVVLMTGLRSWALVQAGGPRGRRVSAEDLEANEGWNDWVPLAIVVGVTGVVCWLAAIGVDASRLPDTRGRQHQGPGTVACWISAAAMLMALLGTLARFSGLAYQAGGFSRVVARTWVIAIVLVLSLAGILMHHLSPTGYAPTRICGIMARASELPWDLVALSAFLVACLSNEPRDEEQMRLSALSCALMLFGFLFLCDGLLAPVLRAGPSGHGPRHGPDIVLMQGAQVQGSWLYGVECVLLMVVGVLIHMRTRWALAAIGGAFVGVGLRMAITVVGVLDGSAVARAANGAGYPASLVYLHGLFEPAVAAAVYLVLAVYLSRPGRLAEPGRWQRGTP